MSLSQLWCACIPILSVSTDGRGGASGCDKGQCDRKLAPQWPLWCAAQILIRTKALDLQLPEVLAAEA